MSSIAASAGPLAERVFSHERVKLIGLVLLAATLLGAFWSPRGLSAIGLHDVASVLSLPFIFYALCFGRVGRVFLVLAALLAVLMVFWWVISEHRAAFLIVTARMVQGFAYFWLAVFCFSRLPLPVLLRLALVLTVSLILGAMLWPPLSGQPGRYGFVSLPLDIGPIHSGVVFAATAFWCLLFLDLASTRRGKTVWAVLYGACFALAIWTVSRSAILAVTVTLAYPIFRRDWRTLLIGCSTALALSSVLYTVWAVVFQDATFFVTISGRLSEVGEGANSRWEKWQPFIQHALSNWVNLLFGWGPGGLNAIHRGNAFFSADGQYIRSLVEFGIVGSLIFHGILLLRFLQGFGPVREIGRYLTFLGLCSIPLATHEVLMIGKPMTILYLVAGSLVGIAGRPTEEGVEPPPIRGIL